MHRQAIGPQAHGFAAEKNERAYIALTQAVLAHHRAAGLIDGCLVERDFHAEDMRRLEQSPRVFLEAEYGRAGSRLIRADPFENRDAVVQAVRQHVHIGLAPGNQLAVEPDHAVTIRK